ncbi:glucose 1-dehydrogenase [Sphingomonas sp. UYP23]
MQQRSHRNQVTPLDGNFNSSNIPNYGTNVMVAGIAHRVRKQVMAKLTGKVAVVTGASKGIGAAIAKAFADEGAAVVVNYASSKAGADAVVASITAAGGKAIAVQADVSKSAQAEALIAEAVKTFGKLDILVNNSGVYAFSPIESVTEEQYRQMFDVNVLGLLLTTSAASKHLGEGGSVINISSSVTSVLPPQSAVYTGSKGAVDAITGVLAGELGARKIRVNAINPGIVETEGTHTAGFIGSDFESGVVAQTPLGRTGQPDDIAAVAVFLASDDARWLSGEKILASGGLR